MSCSGNVTHASIPSPSFASIIMTCTPTIRPAATHTGFPHPKSTSYSGNLHQLVTAYLSISGLSSHNEFNITPMTISPSSAIVLFSWGFSLNISARKKRFPIAIPGKRAGGTLGRKSMVCVITSGRFDFEAFVAEFKRSDVAASTRVGSVPCLTRDGNSTERSAGG